MDHKTYQNLLSAYSLGSLDPEETEIIEKHLQSGCSLCLESLTEYQTTIGFLSLTIKPVNPPPQIKEALFTKIDTLAPTDRSLSKNEIINQIVRAEDGRWEEIFPGITLKTLSKHPEKGYDIILMHMSPGSVLPRHKHLGVEDVYVLEGTGSNDGIHFKAGDFASAPPGSIHEETYTSDGCLMLVVLPKIEFLPSNC